MFKLSERSKRNRAGIDKRLIEISDLAIQLTRVDFGHPEYAGLRSSLEQKELFEAGRSKADGYKKKSKHQMGLALDFYAYVDGNASWDEDHLTSVASAFMQAAMILGYKIRWGGFFKSFTDMPHVELIGD